MAKLSVEEQLKSAKAENLRLSKLVDKQEKEKQSILPGMEGYLITPMQRHFAILRGVTPVARRNNELGKTHAWCAEQVGVAGTKGSIKSVASKWMQNEKVLSVVFEYRAFQEKRVEDSGDSVLRDLLELNEMSMGRKPIPYTVLDDEGMAGIAYKIEVNPTVAKAVIELRGKHKAQGLWSDKTELTGADGAPLDVARQVVYVNADNVDKAVNE